MIEGIKFRDFRHLIAQVCGSNTYVNVWNCRAEFIIGGKSEKELKLNKKQREALEKLKEYIIYTVNDGSISWSGQYQLDDVSYHVLIAILEDNVDVALELIREINEDDIKEKAKELITSMDEGDYVVVRNSAIDYGCWEGCQGYHNVKYVAMIKGKFVLIDNGDAHHAYCDAKMRIIEELTEEEAIEMLAGYIEQIAEKYNYTIAELENYQLDSEAEGSKIKICDKHGRIYFDYYECSECLREEYEKQSYQYPTWEEVK